MRKAILFILLVACITSRTVTYTNVLPSKTSRAPREVSTLETGMRINIKGDNGKYLARCRDCGKSTESDSAGVHVTDPTLPNAIWTVERRGDQVQFKSDIGLYLSICNSCWCYGANTQAVFVNRGPGNSGTLFDPFYLNGGRWAFRGGLGNYLSLCSGCVDDNRTMDFVFADQPDKYLSWTQWLVTLVPESSSDCGDRYISQRPSFTQYPNIRYDIGKYETKKSILVKSLENGKKVTLKGDNGKYLARCRDCGKATESDSAGVHVTDPTLPNAIWTVERRGDQVLFKSDIGLYLSICNSCWCHGRNTQAVFVNRGPGSSSSMFDPFLLSNGRWALRGDVGNYLTTCTGGCVSDNKTLDFVFADSPDKDVSKAQWQISLAAQTFPRRQISIRNTNGKFLTRCQNCGPAQYPDLALINGDDFRTPTSSWTVQYFGDKVALKADSGKYLAKCDTQTYADVAFVYATQPKNNPWALWSPVNIDKGQWAFKSMNGKLLTKCKIQNDGSHDYPEFACVRDSDFVTLDDLWLVPTEFL